MAWNNIIHHPSNIIHLIHIFPLTSYIRHQKTLASRLSTKKMINVIVAGIKNEQDS